MKTLTDEEKIERRKRLDLLIQQIDEDNIRAGRPPFKFVDKRGQFSVSFRRPSSASTSSSAGEKPISQMSPQEFREKAVKLLMERHGYSREQAEAAVNNPY